MCHQNAVHGFALGDVAGLAISVREISVVLADDPAVGELKIAVFGKRLHFVYGTVIQTMLTPRMADALPGRFLSNLKLQA